MVLGASSYGPSAGYPQHGYGHKEDYYKENSYKNGYGHKENYPKSDYYGGDSSSMQMMRPHSGIHAPTGPSHHGYGGYPPNNRYGYDGSNFSGSRYSQHASVGPGYGTSSYGSAMPMGGPSRFQEKYEYPQQGYNSSRPYYQQHNDSSHSWDSKDLDD